MAKLVPEFESLVEDLGVPGIAAIVLLPVMVPVAGKVMKPIAKAAIKGGIVLYEKGKGVVAEVGETLEDLLAEAKAELAAEHEKEEMPALAAEVVEVSPKPEAPTKSAVHPKPATS